MSKFKTIAWSSVILIAIVTGISSTFGEQITNFVFGADAPAETVQSCVGGNGGDGGAVSGVMQLPPGTTCDIKVGKGGEAGEAGGESSVVCHDKDGNVVQYAAAAGGGPGGTGCINF